MDAPDIKLPVFAQTIGASIVDWDGAAPILAADYSSDLCGNPGMFHGGAVAGLLDMAALAAVDADLQQGGGKASLMPVSSTIEFFRPALEERVYASARVIRRGRRVSNVQATLWQGDRDKPVAVSLVTVLIEQASAAPGHAPAGQA